MSFLSLIFHVMAFHNGDLFILNTYIPHSWQDLSLNTESCNQPDIGSIINKNSALRTEKENFSVLPVSFTFLLLLFLLKSDHGFKKKTATYL